MKYAQEYFNANQYLLKLIQWQMDSRVRWITEFYVDVGLILNGTWYCWASVLTPGLNMLAAHLLQLLECPYPSPFMDE